MTLIQSLPSFRWLRIILFALGGMLSTALVPMFLPVAWMDQIHAWLGLGAFPQQPITIYLARSTSLLYGLHGLVLLFAAVHLRTMLPLVRWIGWLHVAFGLVLVWIDLNAGMPWYWTAGEGVPVSTVGGLLVYLAHRSLTPRK